MNSVDDIKSSVNSIDSKLSQMKSDVDCLVRRVGDMEGSQQFISQSFEKNKSDVESIATEMVEFRSINKEISDQLETLRCENLRDNLLFFGVEEGEGEECVDIIKNICSTSLSIFQPDGKKGVGKTNPDNTQSTKSRPIVAKLMIRQQRDKVQKNSPKLKDTNISISEHFPKSVHEKRKTLIPMYKKAFLTRDKLYIEGNLIVNTDEYINKTIRINSHIKSSRCTKNTHKSDNSTTGAQSAPGYLGTKKKATKSRIPSKISSPKTSSSSQNGFRFEILADIHTESD
ncbi:Hypothetical predicted protein [Mytilus galloprovincialis]|uniref:Uncharacterized protein n=1 Tax=Mytilus galloprovincialis TaxID=29158 RepID=A0A8B6FGT1_MYTGA|nr:Hypothetical predicted protein [Mytilus galloprovincialis]